MPDQKITDLTLKSVLSGTEETVLNDAGTDKKTTTQDIANLAVASFDLTAHDVTVSRSVGVAYQNTTGKTMIVKAVCKAPGNTLTDGSLLSDSANPPTTLLDRNAGGPSVGNAMYITLFGIVKSGNYYKLIDNNINLSVYLVIEYY